MRNANARSASSAVGGRALGDDLEVHVVDHGVVARLHQEAAGQRLHRQAVAARIGQAAREQQPQVLLGADDGDRLVGRVRRDDDLGEDLGDRARRLGVERAVERDDAAEGGDRIAAQRLAVGVEDARALGDAAGIGVLDDGDGGGALRIELGDAFVGRVGVVEVVVGELLALHLPRGGDARRAARRRAVERRLLVRVLAVAQRFGELAAEGAERRRVVAELVARTSSRSRRHRRRCAHRPWRRASCAAPASCRCAALSSSSTAA